MKDGFGDNENDIFAILGNLEKMLNSSGAEFKKPVIETALDPCDADQRRLFDTSPSNAVFHCS